jgi:hypothetical protein
MKDISIRDCDQLIIYQESIKLEKKGMERTERGRKLFRGGQRMPHNWNSIG